LLAKLLPFTVSVKVAPPAVADDGLRLVIVGIGQDTVKVDAAETMPVVGSATVTGVVPAAAMSAAVMDAVNREAETKVVVLADPFHCTAALLAKLLPFTVSVKAVPPTVAADGLRLVITGRPLIIVTVSELETRPVDELRTLTVAVPAVAMLVDGIVAVNLVGETYVVVVFEPFHCTRQLLVKLLPLTVSVNEAPPAIAHDGLMSVMVGTGSITVNVAALETSPDEGLSTVTATLPPVAMSAAVIGAVN
jgi:hypothetical protein